MASLFGVDRTRITRHINKIIEENELPISVCAENVQTASDSKIYITKYYNLDMIIVDDTVYAIGTSFNSIVKGEFVIIKFKSLTKEIILNKRDS